MAIAQGPLLVEARDACGVVGPDEARDEAGRLQADPTPEGPGHDVAPDHAEVADDQRLREGGVPRGGEHAGAEQAHVLGER